MAKYAILYGAILILLGIAGYVATGMEHWTALLPALFGLVILLLGLLAHSKEDFQKPAMIAALVVAFVGFLGTVGALPDLLAIFQGDEEALAGRAATISRSVMAVVTLAFMIQGIRSLVAASKGEG